MKQHFNIRYLDRRTGALAQERVFAEPLLYWLYNTRIGAWVNAVLVRHWLVSRLYGWWQRQPWSRARVRRFVVEFGLDSSEFERRIDDYKNFRDFFVRKIDLDRRPIHEDPQACVAPCDGKVLAYPRVDLETRFRVKRCTFDLEACVGDAARAAEFAGGSMLVSRLSFADYHYFHFPTAGVARQAKPVPGKYYAGGPYALRTLVPFFSDNYRAVTELTSDPFGRMLMIEVGALTVGSIEQQFVPNTRVAAGDIKGRFDLGGSTVLLLFRPGVIELDADLCHATAQHLETYVRLGDRVGRRVQP